jgi:hypothetical protein
LLTAFHEITPYEAAAVLAQDEQLNFAALTPVPEPDNKTAQLVVEGIA